MMTPSAPVLVWGERTAALPKSLVYVFSFDIWFTVEPAKAYWIGNEIACNLQVEAAAPPHTASTYHVLDSNLVTLPNGSVHEVPTLWTFNGRDRLRLRSNGSARLAARIIVDGERATSAVSRPSLHGIVSPPAQQKTPLDARRASKRIAVSYSGVANISNRDVFFSPVATTTGEGTERDEKFARLGTAFIALQFETSHPLYRWLVITQFVGFGEIHVEKDPASDARTPIESRRLRFSYDVYSAS
jgi:Protein of unknown function (DUF3237)